MRKCTGRPNGRPRKPPGEQRLQTTVYMPAPARKLIADMADRAESDVSGFVRRLLLQTVNVSTRDAKVASQANAVPRMKF